MHLDKIEYAPDYTWSTGGTPTWVDVGDFKAEDLETGLEDIITTEMGVDGPKQDGVQLNGAFLMEGATPPTPGTRTWFRFTFEKIDGTKVAKVVGGVRGARVRVGEANIRPLGGGDAYHRVEFSTTSGQAGTTIEDDQSP